MTDDRTPYERLAGLTGQELIGYRQAKATLKLQDPEINTCPTCPAHGRPAETIIKMLDTGICAQCHDDDIEARAKEVRDREAQRRAERQVTSGLMDKVKKAQGEQEQERWGAEKAYPQD